MISIQAKSKKTIYRVMIATMVIGFFWGQYFQAPTIIKVLFSFLIWSAIVVFPYHLLGDNNFSKTTNLFLRLLLLMGGIQFIRSVFTDDPMMNNFGNKWLTLLFNEYATLLFVPPLFVYLGNKDFCLVLLKNATETFLLIGALFLILLEMPLGYMAIFVVAFYPYVGKRYKILILITIAEALVLGLTVVRACLIMLFFSIMAYVLVYCVKIKFLTKIFCLLFAIAPLFLAMSIFSMGETKESALNIIMQDVASETDNKKMSTDTRSFLYLEMAQDLSLNNSWTWGKGALAYYYSEAFLRKSTGDHYYRMVCEVPFLNYLMHGGLVYVFLYFGIILIGVMKGLNSNNKFVQSLAVIAIGWYSNSFIGDLNGCRFYHMGFFLLLGICLSPHWRKRTDSEVAIFFKTIR